MNDDEDEDLKQLCTECIGNKIFAKWVADNGKRGKCDFNRSHGRKHAVVSVESFAEHVDEWFRENYGHGEEYPVFEGDSDNPSYETSGDPYKYIMAEELECDEAVVEAISDKLPDADWHDIRKATRPSTTTRPITNREMRWNDDHERRRPNIGTSTRSATNGTTFARLFNTKRGSSKQKNV
jgi:hypothetical protein